MTESVRLAKHVAGMLSCSRREAEQYIEGGWVSVQGHQIEEPGYRLQADQEVTVAPGASAREIPPVTLLYHKPAGMDVADGESASTLLRPENLASDDRSGNRLLRKHLRAQVLVAPLEAGASGLLVFSQEYGVLRKLRDDAAHIEHEYVVDVKGEIIADGLALLNRGLSWQGAPLPAIKASWQNESRLRFAVKTPPAGLIEHMCGEVGLTVVAIKRIRIGRLPMAGLPVGQWRYRLGYERF